MPLRIRNAHVKICLIAFPGCRTELSLLCPALQRTSRLVFWVEEPSVSFRVSIFQSSADIQVLETTLIASGAGSFVIDA